MDIGSGPKISISASNRVKSSESTLIQVHVCLVQKCTFWDGKIPLAKLRFFDQIRCNKIFFCIPSDMLRCHTKLPSNSNDGDR